MTVLIILHINDRQEGSLIISKLILIVLVLVLQSWWCGATELRCLFKISGIMVVPGRVLSLSSGVMQYRHKAYKEFNLKIDLEIAAQINRHKVWTITLPAGALNTQPQQLQHHLHLSVNVGAVNTERGNFILLYVRNLTVI